MSWERETIINFADSTEEADIYTHSVKWQNHIENRLGIKPYADNGVGGRSYKLPKAMIKLPRGKKNMTDEQRKKVSERFAKMRSSKKVIDSTKDSDGDNG